MEGGGRFLASSRASTTKANHDTYLLDTLALARQSVPIICSCTKGYFLESYIQGRTERGIVSESRTEEQTMCKSRYVQRKRKVFQVLLKIQLEICPSSTFDSSIFYWK